jgi:hypothetical protein
VVEREGPSAPADSLLIKQLSSAPSGFSLIRSARSVVARRIYPAATHSDPRPPSAGLDLNLLGEGVVWRGEERHV